ncbi:MAG: LLM class flavin-dependent oxidoreductase [Ilumatobacteraceae bacterium]
MSLSRIGLVVPPVGPWSAQADGYRWAEEVGYDVVYTADHLTHPTMPGLWLGEAFTTLTAAAAVTERILLGTLVASAVFRTPVSLARVAMTVQDISAGRLVLGLGMGSPLCAVADRGARGSLGEMSDRFADVVHGYRAVLDGATDWQGDTTSFGGLETTGMPEGTDAPELLLAGHGPKSLAFAAAYADTWNTYGGPGAGELEDDEFWGLVGRQAGGLVTACERQGRDPDSVRRSLLLGFGRVLPTASVDSYLVAVERAVALGFDELVVYGSHWAGGHRRMWKYTSSRWRDCAESGHSRDVRKGATIPDGPVSSATRPIGPGPGTSSSVRCVPWGPPFDEGVSMSSSLRNYTKALYGFDAVIQRVPSDRWDADSPCEGWSARDVVIHACGVMQAVEAMARTGENSLPATPDPVDDVVALWNTSRDGLLEAVDHPDVLMRVGNYWFGEGTIDDILAFSVWDQLGHSWDVAEAVGLDAHASDDVAEASFAVISANADMLRQMGLMGDPVEVPTDAPAMNRFLGLIGRNPNR